MQSGLLWFDNSASPLPQKIQTAARRYQEKFGQAPNTCFVNPSDVADVKTVDTITVAAKTTILRNHLWLGISK